MHRPARRLGWSGIRRANHDEKVPDRPTRRSDLFDDFVGARQKGRWDFNPEAKGRFEIDGQREIRRRLDGNVGGFYAAQQLDQLPAQTIAENLQNPPSRTKGLSYLRQRDGSFHQAAGAAQAGGATVSESATMRMASGGSWSIFRTCH